MDVNGFLVRQKTMHPLQRLKAPTKRIIITLGAILLLVAGGNYRVMAQDGVTPPLHQQKSCSITKDGAAVDFTVTGRMPSHARVRVIPVERDDEEGNPMLAAYDITLTDEHNQEWQPAYGQPAQVTITDPGFGNGRKLDIFHETEEGREYVTTVVSVNNTVTFPAKHFSVYVIGTPNGKNRMVVALVRTLHNDHYESPDSLCYDTLYMLVKRADTIHNGKFLTRLIYSPGGKDVPKGTHFFGWSRKRNYTAAASDRMTIDVVRAIVYDSLKNGHEIERDLGDTMMFYAVLLKAHNIYYRSQRNASVIIGVEEVLYLPNDSPTQDYVVNESYIPTDVNANFQGWLLWKGDTNIVEGAQPNDVYPNGTPIKIKGDVTFVEDLAYGYWLVFDENGKGATYTAPKFLKSNEIEGITGDTLSEAQPAPPTRFGYTFDGWYTDPDFNIPFEFKGYLNQDTIIHAKWAAKENAYYTIIVWRQNVARNGYDFAESFSLEGDVGYSIASQAIVTGKEGDLDYVTVNGKKLGGIKWVLNGQESDPYTGFTLSTVNPIVDQAVTTDGKAVVNIYFDRMKYKVKLYVVRTNANGTEAYTGTSIGSSTHPEAPGLGNVQNEYLLGNWNSGNIVTLNAIPQVFGSTPLNYDSWGSYRFYYYPLTAYYGEDIRDRWPTHNNITVSGSKYVSWFLMSTAKAFVPGENGTGNGTGGNTLKGEVRILDEQVLGRLDDSTANLLLARYAPTYCNTTFYIYFADSDGTYPDEPSDSIHTRAGQNNYNLLQEKAPSFDGYTYDASTFTGHNGTSYYILNYHYLRKSYSITFRDGVYLDGNGDELQNNSSNTPLRLLTGVTHGANIDSLNSYVPKLPQNEVGFVFDGWYMDEACTREYTFGTMPMGNLVVYARWRQIQYRVFLHPQAGTDPSLNWGNAAQTMNFRISYGGKVSAPTGQRDLYEFSGWYLDPEYQNRFFSEVTALTEQSVSTPYIKNADMTDSMDRWGIIHDPVNGTAFNSDTIGNNGGDRFWITKKLDLYARWRHKLDGAEGVKVQYVCDECIPSSMPKQDTNLYLDKSKMVAAPAATSAAHNKIFAYWVLQNWNSLEGAFVDSLDASGNLVLVYPGGSYTLHLPYAQRNPIGSDSAVYIYRLRAELESFEDNHTFIVWYRNWGKPDGDTVRYDLPDTLTINKMVPIPSAESVGTREGYIYKGWHKKGYGPEGSGQESTFEDRLLGDTTTVNSLWYNPEDGQYYSKDYTTLAPDSLEFYRAYGVGADEVTPYDYFYAVWEPIKYTVQFDKNTTDPSVTGDMPDQVFKYGEEQELSKIGYVYQCHKFLGWSLTPNGEVAFTDQQAILNLTSKSDSIIDLYAQWREESHDLVVSPDSASCLTPGSIDIQLDGVSMPNYTYRVIGLDTTTMQYNDTVWQMVSSGTHITVHHLTHRAYRVEVVTGSECVVSKDTAVFLNPVEITWDNPIETVCSGSPFVIKPSSNDDVRYLWDAPDKKAAAVVSPDTANENNPQEYILCTITNSADSSVTYNIHAILGNCQLGDVPTKIDVSTANYPPFEITISAATDTLCGGTPLEVTATVNDNIYNNNSYTLNWVFNGETVSSTVTDHSATVTHQLTMPDTCRGDFSVEVYYADVTECHVNAVKKFKVRIADWDIPANQASTIHCVKDTVRPHTIKPSIMPVVQDGCGNTLIPTLYNTVVEPADLTCDGTVTYTYEYEDCEGKEKYWSYVYHVVKQAPEITISNPVPNPIPIGTCRYHIPEIGYTLSDCDPTLVTVTQTPSSRDHIQQIDHDSVVTITLTATDKCGLTATESVDVTIPARPTVTPTATWPDFCLGGSTPVTTTATGTSSGSTITWTVEPATGLFTYADDTTFSATAHGTYTLTATVVENGCLATGETSVTVKPSAELTITNQNQTVCFGASISNVYITLLYTNNLETSGNLPAGVTLHSENNGSVISGTPTQAGVFKYYLTASSLDPSCGVTKDSISIEILPFTEGTVSISGDTMFCEGKNTTLHVEPNAKSYTWANSNGILPNTKSYLTVIEPGTYSVTVTALDGCISTGTQIVTRNPRPAVTLELPSPICPDANVQHLHANITSIDKAPYKYYWDINQGASFNETEYQAEPTVTMPIRCETTIYTVTLILEDSSGCQKTVSDTILMKNDPPTINKLVEYVDVSSDGDCKYYIPNRQALGSLVDISGNCTPEGNLNPSIYCPSAHENGSITSTDSVTITVTDACNQSASTKIEVRVPEGMTTVDRDSLVLNSFEWEGATYTESTTVESTSSHVNNTCRVERVHVTVLHTNNPDTAICESGTANLVVKMEQTVRPAVGDVLCLKGTAAPYDTLVLRPDTFLARATADALTPIGVVFYVDPNDDRKGKALALVDAYSEACVWADNNSVNDGNTLNNSIYKAAYDTDGFTNTIKILSSANNNNAPAAYNCYHYDPLTQTTATSNKGWYLPAAGEVSMWFAQRLVINKTLKSLTTYLNSNNSSLISEIPFDNDNSTEKGYWTSTDFDGSNADHVSQEGEIIKTSKTSVDKARNVRAVCSFDLSTNNASAQVAVPHNIGDIITFRDGSQGVVCYINPDNPYSGWAVALQDLNNPNNEKNSGKVMLLPAMDRNKYPSVAKNDTVTWITWQTSDTYVAPNGYTGYGRTEWESQPGYANGMVNTGKLLRVNNSPLATLNIDTSNYWYIPDMMQLRQWYALFPVIKDVDGLKLPNANWGDEFYWSSTGTKQLADFGCLWIPKGYLQSKRGTNSSNQGHIRLVRDFDLSISWDNNAAASTNRLADTIQVSPSATQKYYATVKFCGWTLRDSATVTVVTKPVITAKNGTEVRDLGCNPATIPTMTVDSFTVEDNSKPDAKVTLTRRDTSGIEHSRTWMATYQNKCEQNADTVRVTYRWCELSVKAKDSTKVFDGEALPATFVCTPSGTTPTVRYKVQNADESWPDEYTTDIPSITHAGSLTYLVETTVGSCNCTVTDTATLTITKRPVTFTATSEEKSYTGSEITINNLTVNSGENAGLVNGHTHNATFSASGTEAGEYTGTITAANNVTIMSGDNDVTASYDISVVNGKLTITKTNAEFTISLANDEYVYNATARHNTKTASSTATTGTTTYSYSFEPNGTYVSDLSSLTKTDVGEYTIYVKGENPNYEKVAMTTSKLTITKRPVTFTATDEVKTYTGSLITINNLTVNSGENEGLVDGHTHNVTFSASGTEAGEYTGTITAASDVTIMSGNNNVTANYDISVENGKLTITKTSDNFTISLANDEYEYDATAHHNTKTASSTAISGTTTYSYSFEQNGTYVSDLSSLTKTEAGEYTLYVKGVNPNYLNVATTTAKLTITKKAITITAGSDTKVYNGSALTKNSFTNTDLANGDQIENVTVTGSQTLVGSSHNDPSAAVIKNASGEDVTSSYDVTYVNGTLEVTRKAVTLTAKGANKPYDGTALTEGDFTVSALESGDAHTFSVTMTSTSTITQHGTQPNVIATVDGVQVTTNNPTAVGNYMVTTVDGSLTISKKAITITADNASKIYDGTALTKNSFTNTDLASGDHIESVTVTGSQTVVGSSHNVPSAAVIKNANNVDVTSSYDIAYANGTLEVTRKAVTITAGSDTKVYNSSPLTKNSYSNTPLASDDHIESVTVTGSQTVVGSSNNVPSVAVIKNSNDVDVTSSYNISYVNGTLEVTRKEVTITANSANQTYDGTALTEGGFTATALETGDTHTFVVAMTPTSTITNYGTQPNVIATVDGMTVTTGAQTEVGNYLVTTMNGTLTISKKAITITADNASKVYNSLPLTKNTYTNTETDLAEGDHIESVTVTGSQTAAGTSENVPSDAVILNSNNDNVTSSYNITYVNGTLEVTRKAVTITALNANKTFDGAALTEGGFTATPLEPEDTHTFLVAMTSSSTITNYGTQPNVIATVDGETVTTNNPTAVGNYMVTTVDGLLSISKRDVTVTAQSHVFAYDGTTTFTWPHYNVDGLVGSDAINAVVTGSITFPSESPVTNELTSYEFTTGTPGNYNVTKKNGELTMSNASNAITITAASQTWTYDGNAHQNATVTITAGELIGNNTLVATASGSVRNVSETAAGNNPVSQGYKVMHGNEDVTANYAITTEAGTLTITKKAITITAGSGEKVYDGTALTNNSYTNTDLANGDYIESVTVTGSRTAAGTNPNVPSAAVIKNGSGEDVTSSYDITYVNGTLKVNPKEVTITALDANKTYDGTALTKGGFTVSALESGDAHTFSVTMTSTSTITQYGTKPNVIATVDGVQVTTNNPTAVGNYMVTTVDGTLTISQMAITITADNALKIYDGTALTKNSFTNTDLADGDAIVSVTVNGSQTVVGSSHNVPSAAVIKNANNVDVTSSYDIAYANGTLEVTRKAVTITAGSDTKVYNSSPLTKNSYSNTPLASDDHIESVTVTGSQTVVGSSNNVPSVAVIKNSNDVDVTSSYNISYVNGTLEVTRKEVTITANSANQTYDGTALTEGGFTATALETGDTHTFVVAMTPTSTITNYGTQPNVIATVDGMTVTTGAQTEVGNYLVTTATGTLTIHPKPVTLTAKSQEFTYDGTAHSNNGYKVVGLVGSDSIHAVVTGSITFPTQSPVTNTLASYEFITGVSDNYIVTTANGQLTMTKAEVAITITAASQAWTYDGNAHSNSAVSVTSGALLSGDQLVASASGSVTNVSETADSNNIVNEGYKIMHGTQDVTENYVITPVNGKLTINPKGATVKAQNNTFVYSGTAQSWPQYVVSGLVGSDAITATITSNITFPSQSPVPNVVDSYSFTTGTASNYTVSLEPGQLTMVNAAVPITITAASQEWTYDGAAHSNDRVKVTSGTLLTGDSLVATATGSVTSVADNATSNNPIAPGYKVMHGTEDVTANYVFTTQFGKLTIKPKAVTVTANSDAFTYDGTAHSNNGYVVNGLVGSDAISAVVTGSITFPSQSPATNTLTSYQFTAGTPGNYSVTKVNGQLTMTPANVPITITAASDSKIYDGTALTNATVTVTSGSLLPGDSLVANANGSVTNVADVTTGNNPVAPGYKIMHGTQDVTANYTITRTAGTLEITPRTVTVSVADKTVEYNGALQNGNTTCTFENVVAGQTATIGYTAANGLMPSETPYNNSSYADNFIVMAGTTDVTSNYTLTEQTTGKLTIKNRTNKYSITVVAKSNTGNVYDGSVKSASGFQTLVFSYNNNPFTVSGLTTSNPSSANVCELANTISGTAVVNDAQGNDVTSQFNVTTLNGVLEILKRPVTVSVADKTVDYNGSLQYGSTDYTFSNVVSGQTATIDYLAANGTTESPTPYNNGSYGSNFKVMSGETNVTSNYTLTLMKKGKLKIDPAPLTVTAKDSTKTYDGMALQASFTFESNESQPSILYKVKNGDTWSDYTTDLPSITNAGSLTYLVEASIATYTTTDTATLTITKRDVHLTSMDSTRIYNGNTLRYDSVKVTGNGFVNGEGATFTVTGSQLLPGSTPNVFDYTLNPGTLADNYIITKSYGTLHVDERPDSLLYPITVVSNSNPVATGLPIFYDGLKHSASDFVTLTFTTEDGHPYTVTGLTANVSGFDAGTYPNTIHGNPTVLDEHGHDVTDQFYTELVKGTLVIRKRPVTITVPSEHATMMYNGDSLKVDFENIDITTLADRDTLKSGYVISEGYTAGTYHCNDGFFMATDMTGVASQHNFSIIHGASDEYSAGNSMTNYRPKFQVTLTITKRPLEITASSAEKVYDGAPLTLTESDYTLTSGTTIAPSDTLMITRSGAQACVGESANHITSVTILHKGDWVDVTSSYNITTVDGLLKVTAESTGLTCPETLTITLAEGTYDTLVPQSLLGTPSHDLLYAGVASVSNDLDEQNPLTVGTHTIKWILYDTCHTAMDSCYQTVVVNFSPCEGVTYHGHFYDAKRIGYQCWMTENLRNETDAEGLPIANRHAYKEIPENLDKFGYLYSWYSAMNVPEGDDTAIPADSIGDNGRPYVQGICPDGWAVGDHQDFSVLFDTVNNTTLLKDAGDGYWLPEFGGTLPNSGFNARANGLFNSAAHRFEDLLTGAHFWMPETGTADGTAANAVLQYYCSDGLFQQNPKGDLKGVRCIRKVAP